MIDLDAANREMSDIFEWAVQEEERIIKKLKEDGKFKGGLDGYYEELEEVKRERDKRLRELKEKYKVASKE